MLLRATHPVQLVLGLTLWAVFFVIVYGGMSVACAVAPPLGSQGPLNWINIVLALVTVAFTAGLLGLAWFCWTNVPGAQADRTGRFIARVAAALNLWAAVATLAVGIPVLVLPPCI